MGRAFLLLKNHISLPAEITFHSFQHTVFTQLRNAHTDIRDVWIDRLLGHEATHKSQGTTTYLTSISIANLLQTIDAINHPETTFKKVAFSKGDQWYPIAHLARKNCSPVALSSAEKQGFS
ncbi:hypothetical protein [Acetobacter sp.]|uniref:hypothetical protein n=1 Tax=Acetobacter sp. TaxID=440 RepID=UPI0039EB6E16